MSRTLLIFISIKDFKRDEEGGRDLSEALYAFRENVGSKCTQKREVGRYVYDANSRERRV